MDLTNGSSVIIFDMDGVLVDVSESYLAAIAATVFQLTQQTPSPELIQRYKNEGGWNNDWELSHRLVTDLGGGELPYAEVVKVFQSRFLGTKNDGLILRERWLPADGFLARLSERSSLAIFTGRPRTEVDLTLQRFAPNIRWSEIIADGDVPTAKPAPDGLHAIQSRHPGAAFTYVGDIVDDAQSAHAAGVRFIGIAEGRTAELLRAEGAAAVIPNVNHLEDVL